MADKKDRLISFKKSTEPGRLPGDFRILINGYDYPDEILWGLGAIVGAAFLASVGNSFWGCIICLAFAGICFYKSFVELKKQRDEKQILEGAKKLKEFVSKQHSQKLETNIDAVIKQIQGGIK